LGARPTRMERDRASSARHARVPPCRRGQRATKNRHMSMGCGWRACDRAYCCAALKFFGRGRGVTTWSGLIGIVPSVYSRAGPLQGQSLPSAIRIGGEWGRVVVGGRTGRCGLYYVGPGRYFLVYCRAGVLIRNARAGAEQVVPTAWPDRSLVWSEVSRWTPDWGGVGGAAARRGEWAE